MKIRKASRRAADRRSLDRRIDVFGPVMRGLTSAAVGDALTRKDARIEIRCSAATKVEMEAVAGRFGLTVTDYLLRLHGLAAARLDTYDR